MFKEKLFEDALRFYLGQHVLDRLLRDGRQAMELGTEWRQMSVLWIDIRRFVNPHAEFDWQQTQALLVEYQTRVLECIAHNGGIVDGFSGDAVLAYWDSEPRVNHAALALSCAADLLQATSVFSKPAGDSERPHFKSDIGVAAGHVGIGNIGTPKRAKFTLMGNVINLASRLVYRCPQYGVQVLASDEVVKLAGDAGPPIRMVDSVTVKGMEDMLDVFTLANVRQI